MPGLACRYVVSLLGLLGLALLQEALCSYRAAYYRHAAKPSDREVPFAQSRRAPSHTGLQCMSCAPCMLTAINTGLGLGHCMLLALRSGTARVGTH